ncbi:MAG: DUF4230 domain-containing protein [Ignavibacteria bacterium]|nr:DUF4230 domain-containing protein [Ignavibacteria bacterium]
MEKAGAIRTLWAKVVTKIGIAAVVMIGVIFIVIHFIESSSRAIKEISENFESGKITTEFRDYVTEVKGFQRLQVASLKTVDIFTKLDSKSILWNLIDLPDVKIEIKIPVEYTYYLDLKDQWDLQWNEEKLSVKVIAPNIKSGTPAVDISKMNITVQKGSFLRDVESVKNELIGELSEKLAYLADKKIPWIREAARNETKEFINNWFVQIHFKDKEIKPKLDSVFFADEIKPIEKVDSIKLEQKLL